VVRGAEDDHAAKPAACDLIKRVGHRWPGIAESGVWQDQGEDVRVHLRAGLVEVAVDLGGQPAGIRLEPGSRERRVEDVFRGRDRPRGGRRQRRCPGERFLSAFAGQAREHPEQKENETRKDQKRGAFIFFAFLLSHPEANELNSITAVGAANDRQRRPQVRRPMPPLPSLLVI
jgi:hypothetical protein